MLQAENTTEYAVEVQDLTKRFDSNASFGSLIKSRREDVVAVDHVNLNLRWGEIFGLVGPNGAGKTTLIKMLSTLLMPTSGVAKISGYDVATAGQSVRPLVGLVTSNERSFYWRLTGRQNLSFFADLYHLPTEAAQAWTEEMCELLGLRRIIDKRFDGYSTGQRQRLAMARGLLSKPKILFMDEPTKGVDPIGAAEIVEIIRERVIQLWDPTILVTSHNLQEIERLCGRMAFMDRGRVVAMGALEELRHMAAVSDSYRLVVRGLSTQQLEAITRDTQSAKITPLPDGDGRIELEISYLRESNGFSRLIRATIEQGGDVAFCTAVEASIDDVFHAVISKENQRRLDKE